MIRDRAWLRVTNKGMVQANGCKLTIPKLEGTWEGGVMANPIWNTEGKGVPVGVIQILRPRTEQRVNLEEERDKVFHDDPVPEDDEGNLA